MIEIMHFEVLGWEPAIRGMRNPMNSWYKTDSVFDGEFLAGESDLDLMLKLAEAGSDHRKFMRMITAYLDINAPLYWWKEFDTYKVGTVSNSCSTMHKLMSKEFDLGDFSHDHMDYIAGTELSGIIRTLNLYRDRYLKEIDPVIKKRHWYAVVQLLPSSYNQKRTVMLNYEVLRNIYHARKNHKLDEWHDLCDAIRQLPYSRLITGGD